MRVALVTGASGFIGRALCRRLQADGVRVRALMRSIPPSGGPWDETIAADLRLPLAAEAVRGADTVFHLAGKAHALSERNGDEQEYRSSIVDGTRSLLAAASAVDVERFVFFSSVKAMGEATVGCVDETAEPRPATPYGRAKLEAERLVLETGARTGMHAACLRLPLVYGPGQKGNLQRMIRAIDRGLFPPLPDLGHRRSLVHVDNVVHTALLAASRPEANGHSYIVTDGAPYSTRELHRQICRALGRRPPRWHVPWAALKALALAGDALGRLRGRRLPFDSDALEKLLGPACYSSEKIGREIGYVPTVSFAEALPAILADREARAPITTGAETRR